MKQPLGSSFELILLLSLILQLSTVPVSGKPTSPPKSSGTDDYTKDRNARQRLAIESLKDAWVLQLFSIDPDGPINPAKQRPNAKLFSGWQILGQCDVTAEESDKLLDALRGAMQSKNLKIAECFEPRHALKLQTPQGVRDALICFACYEVHIYDPSKSKAKRLVAHLNGGGEVFRLIVKKHHLPEPKSSK